MSDTDDSSDFDEEKQENLVRDFETEGKMILNNLLPRKSFERYEAIYNNFMEWCTKNKTDALDEKILLVYFNEISKKIKPSTIWARWSMLRTTLMLRHDLNIGSYVQLKSFLKNFSKGYKPKQAKVLLGTEIEKFLELADDFNYLVTKVILIFGISGATRCCELVNLKISDVDDLGNYFNVQIKDSKNDYPRTFVICEPYYQIVQKYLSLRPPDIATDRFFIYYNKGKCFRQVIGKHKIGEVPKTIASFLNLENVDAYTGHSLRRTSATLLSDSGASLIRIKNLGAWKSDAVAQRYIDCSKITKKQNFNDIVNSINSSSGCSSTSKNFDDFVEAGPSSESVKDNSITKCPLQSVENLNSIGLKNKTENVLHSKESSRKILIENVENINSPRSGKKRKFKQLSTDEDVDIDSQNSSSGFYNCEINVVNFNYCKCHENCVRQ